MKIKIFISQPMRGKTNAEIIAEREDAIRDIKSLIGSGNVKIKVLKSFFKHSPTAKNSLWYLGKSLKLMSKADAVYFAKGWQNMRGCLIERECAEKYGIPIFEQ